MPRIPLLLVLCLGVLALGACGGGGNAYEPAALPVIASVEPASGAQAGGTPITIRGTNLANTQAGTYAVLVGGQVAAEIVVISSSEVQCKTPAGAAGPADVEITTRQGTGVGLDMFMYYPPPTITSITPEEGTRDGGTAVTVVGSGFANNDPGETVCLIGLKELDDQVVVDDSTLTGLTPTSWTEVPKNVDVVNRNGQGTLSNGFTYVGPVPVIYSVTPNEGQPTGGLLVTIVGDYFTEAGGELSVAFGDAEASLVTRVDDQTLTCLTPVSPVVGFVDVSVTNNNGTFAFEDGFYYYPSPVITGIVPNSGPFDGGTFVTITGANFAVGGAVIVRFGSNAATSVNVVNDNTITCTTPAGDAIGLADVTVLNANGQGIVTDGFEYTAPAFWWEETFGTPCPSQGDGVAFSCSIQNGFPYFGTTWNSVYAISDGHLDFGSYTTSYSIAHTLFAFPHISIFGCDGYVWSDRNMYYTNHVSGRTIVTYDDVPEYSTNGANSIQVHLHQSGIFAILWKNASFHLGTWNPYGTVAVNPGNGSNVSVDWTDPQSGGSGDAMNEGFTGTNDLQNSHIVFVPNSGGGYDSTWTNGVPTDPDP